MSGAMHPIVGGGNTFIFNAVISANTNNYVVTSAAIAAGWNQKDRLLANITVNSGVVVGSTSTGSYAFSTGTSLPVGSTLYLINNGSIVGAGGNGSTTNYSQGAGPYNGPGGPALYAACTLIITNNGTIGGGGGGGGYGSVGDVGSWQLAGACGGGGAGSAVGPGGLHGPGTYPPAYTFYGSSGNAGTLTAGGSGSSSGYGGQTCTGGTGGALGSAGGSGYTSTYTNGGNTSAGSAGGAAINGNSYITWNATGTRLGAIT